MSGLLLRANGRSEVVPEQGLFALAISHGPPAAQIGGGGNVTTAFCHRCGRTTETTYLLLSSGHVGNACAECRALRKGRPYVSKSEYEKSTDADRPRVHHDHARA
jgi:hypothetical protein